MKSTEMMNKKEMKNVMFLLLFTLSFMCSCGISDEEKARMCHYPYKYENRHYLKVPLTVSPHQLTYKVGDTITVTANFCNQIEDISYERIFTIDSALFRPVITFFRFDDSVQGQKVSGPENILIDSIYHPVYKNSFHSFIKYENKNYTWRARIIIRKPGKYVFTIGDTSKTMKKKKA